MYKDLRIRNAYKPTPIPYEYRAFVFRSLTVDHYIIKVILAPSYIIAYQRLKDFNEEQGLDLFWTYEGEDDFEVVHRYDVPPRLF